ncbi:cytochrome d ubiquinol oxidase subunit II [Streptomyces roseicoloratus]|uniref:Cytochrome d ubiquinol oxidase subunit II n=1 Tax=Streptomyces roseicoloratus TaxID=2508722 RepID=A0ABY9RP21_9ACTN|nr:cytochrome d ubiquinol oxidase subunit II [Streptomyces roseicoloratus]WMX43945.1 cytochrome d ubiquinol oxidase subunit II [Streptomyces roseicoloratus]
MFALASVVTPFFLGAAVGGVASERVAPGTDASAHVWTGPTSIVFGVVAVTTTAFLGAVFLTGDAHRFEAPDLVGHFRRRALGSLAALAVLAVITGFVTHEDSPYVWHGLTHGLGLFFVILAGVASLLTAWLLPRTPGTWLRVSAVGVVGSAVVAWGTAQRPYLLPTSLTVADAAGAPATLTWLAVVTLVALLLVMPAVFLLYWLDTHGELEELTDSELRGGRGTDGDGTVRDG